MKSEHSPSAKPWYRKHLPVIVGAGLCVVSVGIVLFVRAAIQNAEPPRRVTQITVMHVPPPPPPPPEVQPPPPEMKEKVEIPQMQPPQDSPPAGSDLGVDADGSGADNFGLKARKGGRGLLDGGPFGWYAARLDSDIQDHIARDKKLRRQGRYTVELRMWIGRDGKIERVELVRTTGRPEIDQALESAVAQMPRVAEPPPEMPQPVNLKITARL